MDLGSKDFGIRFALIFSFVILVGSSSTIVNFVNPVLSRTDSSSSSSSPLPTISTIPTAPSIIGQARGGEGDVDAQLILQGFTVRPSNDIVGTKAFYDIVFLTTTSGPVKTVVISFPGGTGLPTSAFLNEVEGIGPGTVTKSGNVLRYTVNDPTPPVIPAGTKIRLEYANIINPGVPGSYVVTGSTRDVNNNFIDGPTQSVSYSIKQKGTSAIANNAVTNPKIADNAVTNSKISDSAITTNKISDSAITTNKIADGALSLNVIRRDGFVTTVNPSSITTASAGCIGSETLVGGGYEVDSGTQFNVRLIDMHQGAFEWIVRMGNAGGGGTITFHAIAHCIPAFP